jgi:hypothetical protein
MSSDEVHARLREADEHLAAAIQELVQMDAGFAWQEHLQRASDVLQAVKGAVPGAKDELSGAMLESIGKRTSAVEDLLARAASFQYGCMASACPAISEYTPAGEAAASRCEGVIQAHG